MRSGGGVTEESLKRKQEREEIEKHRKSMA